MNAIFHESPAGVGFSYSKTSPDYRNAGDERAERDLANKIMERRKRRLDINDISNYEDQWTLRAGFNQM